MYIIRAIPGSCGDIVSAVIDNTGMFIQFGQMKFLPSATDRTLLKMPNINYSTVDVDVEKLSRLYKSISCQHYVGSIVTDTRSKSITIDISDDVLFKWCINRLSILMPKLKEKFTIPHLQLDLEHHRRFSNLSIDLLDIIKGNLIHKFNEYNIPYNNADLYYKWLEINTKKFPYNFV